MGFIKEQISKVHLREEITCINCHGLSASHANDENIGATPPDIRFARNQIDTMCVECHDRHKISADELAGYESYPVCTDCHGSHRLDGSAG
jgi:predicted CXXCH cytochrome family protein